MIGIDFGDGYEYTHFNLSELFGLFRGAETGRVTLVCVNTVADDGIIFETRRVAPVGQYAAKLQLLDLWGVAVARDKTVALVLPFTDYPLWSHSPAIKRAIDHCAELFGEGTAVTSLPIGGARAEAAHGNSTIEQIDHVTLAEARQILLREGLAQRGIELRVSAPVSKFLIGALRPLLDKNRTLVDIGLVIKQLARMFRAGELPSEVAALTEIAATHQAKGAAERREIAKMLEDEFGSAAKAS
jgi:hypothetical protein